MARSAPVLLVALAGIAAGASAQSDIIWNAGSGVWSAPGNWSPVNVPDNTSENARIPGVLGREVTLNSSYSINLLEVGSGSTLVFNEGQNLNVFSDILNDGFITINPSTGSGNSYIQFNSNTSLIGGGILRLSGGGNDAQLFTNGVTVTNGAGHTIDGAGEIHATLINNGVVSAIDSGFGNRLDLIGGAKTNNLTFQAGPSAELFLSNIGITQGPSGIIGANSGGQVTFNANVTINGGRLVGTGDFVRIGNGTLTMTDVMVDVDIPVQAASQIQFFGPTFDCSGVITLNDSGSASNAYIQFNSNTTATGGGRIFLAGGGAPGAANDSAVFTNGTTLTVATDFVIEGSGELPATLINNGLVRAFPSTNGDGRLRLIGGGKTNNTQMIADAGGVLEVNNIIVTQSPTGTLLADEGQIDFNANATVNGGTLRTINGGTIRRRGNGTLTMTDVMVDADIPVEQSSQIQYFGSTFNCSGDIVLNDSTSSANGYIQFNSDTTATGGGRIFLAGGGTPGAANDSQIFTNGTTLTIASDFVVEGSGEINATLVNNGLLRAFPSLNGDGRLRLISGGKTNNTQMIADAGGVIEVSNITVTQGPAGVLLADEGQIDFNANATVNGGTLRTINGGTIRRRGNGTLTMTDVMVDADIPVEQSSQIQYFGETFDCTGDIILNDSASTANGYIQFNSNTTATGGGRIFLAGGGNDSQVFTNGTTLTVAPDFVVEGSGEIYATMVNNGLVRAFPSDNGDGRLRLISGGKVNNALMVADPGGVLEINTIGVTQNSEGGGPGLLVADGGIIEFASNVTLTGGVLRDINGGRLIRTNSGTLSIADLTLEGDLEILAGGAVHINGNTLVNNGGVIINDSASTANSIVQFNGNTVVTGAGRFLLGGGGDDSQMFTNGTTATFGPDQRLEGEGRLSGSLVHNGTIEPGLPIGSIVGIGGTFTFGDSAVFEAQTDGPGSGDRLQYNAGTVNIDGDVRVALSYVPAVNDEFVLVSAPTINGIFDDVNVTIGSLPTNIDVRLVYTSNEVLVKFVCIADIAEPFGVLDLSDVTVFVDAFLNHDPLADLAEPIGLFDLADLNAFVVGFLNNCE